MARRDRLNEPLLARLANALTSTDCVFGTPVSTKPASIPTVVAEYSLSAEDLQMLEQSVAEWDLRESDCKSKFNEIVDIALRRLQWELNTGYQDAVIADLRLEIDYRLWCGRRSTDSTSLSDPDT